MKQFLELSVVLFVHASGDTTGDTTKWSCTAKWFIDWFLWTQRI